MLMTYGVGPSAAATHNVLSLLACSHEFCGHSHIDDVHDIVGSLSSMYKFFSFEGKKQHTNSRGSYVRQKIR
jgi:hypothetical protein